MKHESIRLTIYTVWRPLLLLRCSGSLYVLSFVSGTSCVLLLLVVVFYSGLSLDAFNTVLLESLHSISEVTIEAF